MTPIRHCIVLIEFSGKKIENFYLKIGENVKRVRKEKNISQMQLALAIEHNSVGHVAKAELCKYDKHFSKERMANTCFYRLLRIGERFYAPKKTYSA